MFDFVDLYLCDHSFGVVFLTDLLVAVAFGSVTIRQNNTRPIFELKYQYIP